MRGPLRGWGWRAVLLSALWGLTGCQVGRAMIATSGDYADYRRIRTAETLDERLAAAWYYINHQRDGAYTERVRSYFRRAEPVFWKVKRRNEAGLETYLQALPNGPHAAEALGELMHHRRARRRDLARRLDGAAAAARLDAEQRERERIGELPIVWLQRLLAPALWHAPLPEAPRSFIVAYRLELPAPLCERDDSMGLYRCSKVIERSFPVVRGDDLLERPVLLWVELTLGDDWRLRSARLLGPELFVRRAEARQRQPLSPDDGRGRRRAVEQFERRVMEVLAESPLGCEPIDAPAGLAVRCSYLTVTVRHGDDQEDDEILVTRSPQARLGSAPAPTEAVPDPRE